MTTTEKLEKLKKYQEIITEYHKQQDEEYKRKQEEREAACSGHEYEYTNSKWQSVNQQRCMNCGKTIN